MSAIIAKLGFLTTDPLYRNIIQRQSVIETLLLIHLFSEPGFENHITRACCFPNAQIQGQFTRAAIRQRARKLAKNGTTTTIHASTYIGYAHFAVLWLIRVLDDKIGIPDVTFGRRGKQYPFLTALRSCMR